MASLSQFESNSRQHSTFISYLRASQLDVRAALEHQVSLKRLPALFQFGENQLGQFFQRFEHALSLNRNALKHRLSFFS